MICGLNLRKALANHLSSDKGAFIIFILIASVSRPLSTIRTDRCFSKVYVLLLFIDIASYVYVRAYHDTIVHVGRAFHDHNKERDK